jgi:hypothetical protein
MIQWYYKADGEEHGPVSQGELQALAALGQISPDDLVRNDKKPKWYPARAVKGLVVDDDDVPSDGTPDTDSDSESHTREVLDLETANEHLSERVFVPKARTDRNTAANDETKDTAEQILTNRKKNTVFGASRAEIEAATATPMDMADEFRYMFGIPLPRFKKFNTPQKVCLTLTLMGWLMLCLFAPHAPPPEAAQSNIYSDNWDKATGKPGADPRELTGRHTTWILADGPRFLLDMRDDTSWRKNGPFDVKVEDQPQQQQQSTGTNRDGIDLNNLMNADKSPTGTANGTGIRSGQLQAAGKQLSGQQLSAQYVAYSKMTVNWFRWSMESLVVIVLGGIGCYYLR